MGPLSYRIFLFILLVCLFVQNQFTEANKANPKIVIIGAGAAGIAAATSLVDDGFTDVKILELKPRIGGRINTVAFGKNVIDLGAEWVHGDHGNVVYELASKHNLLENSADEFDNYSFVRSNGEVVPPQVWKHLRNITDKIEELRLKEISDFKGSLGEYTKRKYEEILALPENADIDKKIANEYYKTYEKELSCDEGTESLDVISARDYTQFQELEGDAWMNWKDKGFIEFLQLLMDTHKTGKDFGKLDGKIELSKPVVHIQWQRDDEMVLLKTQAGEEHVADHVIVTVPLGVLKSNSKELFEPNLPTVKEKAIENLGFGLVNKIFLEFKQPFWQPDWNGVYLLWRNEDLEEMKGTERNWLLDVVGFYTVSHQPNVLAAWIAGKGARHMEELSLEEIKVGCLYILNKFMPTDVKEIINIKFSNWATDPAFRGAVSFHSLETEKANVDNDQLAEPIKLPNEKPILLFAGEATESKHYATVHGAVESGQREAKRLRDYYKMNEKANEIPK